MGVILDWKSMADGQDKRHAYYASREWALVKERVRSRSGGTCEHCRRCRASQVHHQTYVRLYRERPEDLLHVCEACHQFISGRSHVDPRTVSPPRPPAPAPPPPHSVRPAYSPPFRDAPVDEWRGFRIGSVVEHPDYGVGTIDRLSRRDGEASGPEIRAAVAFVGSIKTFILDKSPLKLARNRPIDSGPISPGIFAEPEPKIISQGICLEILDELTQEVGSCLRCGGIAESRCCTVAGEGASPTRLMFIGEAPGIDEDRSGSPFVGRAGQLLDHFITRGFGLSRRDVFLTNVLKCRPPENRTPTTQEVANCFPFLERQIAVVRPEFLCLLGKTAAMSVLETVLPMSHLRGKWHRYKRIPTIVTYHPSALIRNPGWQGDAIKDFNILAQAMGLKFGISPIDEAEPNPLANGWALGWSP